MLDRFVGIPFADKGRTFDGCDCWGLVRLVLAELRGIALPSYSEQYVAAEDRRALSELIAGELGPWREVPDGSEQPFDAVLMREGRFARHIGLVIAPGRLLHVEQGRTSCIERYRDGVIRPRVVGFYRFVSGNE
jgi:cell wall-associated NlpC family hydrolase